MKLLLEAPCHPKNDAGTEAHAVICSNGQSKGGTGESKGGTWIDLLHGQSKGGTGTSSDLLLRPEQGWHMKFTSTARAEEANKVICSDGQNKGSTGARSCMLSRLEQGQHRCMKLYALTARARAAYGAILYAARERAVQGVQDRFQATSSPSKKQVLSATVASTHCKNDQGHIYLECRYLRQSSTLSSGIRKRKSTEAEEALPTPIKEVKTRWLKRAVSPFHHKATERPSGDLEGYWKHPAPDPGYEKHFWFSIARLVATRSWA
eukprot:1157605-Pelagomonas_calceolata.AAC.5